ncbi:MAG: hypothetical protein ACREV9_07545 [Burkholderiales bacterium]
MTDKVRKVSYFSIQKPDQPGQGAHLLKALKDSGVNLLAFTAFPSGRQAQMDLVPEDTEALRAAAKKMGLSLSEQRNGFLVQGKDRVGAITEMTQKLADAGINITALDAIAAGEGRFGAIFWIGASDVHKAAQVLGAT